MKKLLVIAIILFCFYSQAVFALDTLGPPVARLKKGQFSAGVDYSCSDTDFRAKGKSKQYWIDMFFGRVRVEKKHSFRIRDVKINRVYGDIAYGINDKWEVSLYLGGANTDVKDDQSRDFAIGFGTRVTFYDKNNLKLGAVAAFSWLRSHYDSMAVPHQPLSPAWPSPIMMAGTLSLCEIQIAIGANYELRKSVSIYGGPFLHFADGDLCLKDPNPPNPISIPEAPRLLYLKNSYDIDEVSYFGGYIGAEIDIAKNISYNIEYQHTAAADALGMKLICRLK